MSHFYQLGIIAVVVFAILGLLWAAKHDNGTGSGEIGASLAGAVVLFAAGFFTLAVLAIQGCIGW